MKVGFIDIKKYSNVSQKIISRDYFKYFSDFFEVIKLKQDYSNLDKWFEKVVKNKIKYIFLNDWPNPGLFRYRTNNKVDVNFIILPYVFTFWKNRYEEIVKYIKPKDIVAVHSKFLEKSFKRISNKFQVFKMPIPVDCTLFNPIKSKKKSELDIVFCGRMLPCKGLDILLEALHRIQNKYFFKLHIISETENRNYQNKVRNIDQDFYLLIRKLISNYNLQSKVTFYGSLSEKQKKKNDILSSADILVYLSTDEGETFGRVIIEAFAAGLAVVVTKWQALDELVTDYKNGFLVNVNKNKKIDTNEVSSAIKNLYDLEFLKIIQDTNLLKAKKYDYRAHIKRLHKKLCPV